MSRPLCPAWIQLLPGPKNCYLSTVKYRRCLSYPRYLNNWKTSTENYWEVHTAPADVARVVKKRRHTSFTREDHPLEQDAPQGDIHRLNGPFASPRGVWNQFQWLPVWLAVPVCRQQGAGATAWCERQALPAWHRASPPMNTTRPLRCIFTAFHAFLYSCSNAHWIATLSTGTVIFVMIKGLKTKVAIHPFLEAGIIMNI